MKKLLLACSIATLTFASASAIATEAAAQGPGATTDWTGFYAGVHLGYGYGDGDGSTGLLPSPVAFGAAPFTSSIDFDGFAAGGQAGFNWQSGSFLFGVEADLAWTDIDGTDRVTPLSTAGGTPIAAWFQDGTADVNWFGTLRARAGIFANPTTMIYLTGGAAFADVEYTTFTSFTPAPMFQYAGSDSETAMGWTAGGGVEWSIGADWSMKAEYLYFDLDDEVSYNALPLAANPPFEVTQRFETEGRFIRFGVNRRF